MIYYHVDRSNSLHTNQIISINYNYSPNNAHGTDLLSKLDLPGVSKHGERYLNDSAYFSYSIATLNDVAESNNFNSTLITEYTFELIRQLYFPTRTSRLTSFFCLKNIDDLHRWPELQNYQIFEIHTDQEPVTLDAFFLMGGLAFSQNTETSFYQGFSPSLNFHLATKYWSGEVSDNPKPEILLNLPVTIGDKIII